MDWTKTIGADDLGRLLNGLSAYMLFEPEIYGRLMDEKWTRFAAPAEAWPSAGRQSRICDLEFVRFCSSAQSPNDPGHRPHRRLVQEKQDERTGQGLFYECSCGIRDGDARYQFQIDKLWRAPGPLWWPHQHIDGVVRWGVCPDASHADDCGHAPIAFEERPEDEPPNYVRCICRRLYALRGKLEYDESRDIPNANWMAAQ